MKDRSALMAAKTEAVQRELSDWARAEGILGPGEQVVFSMFIRGVPVVVLEYGELLRQPVGSFLREEGASNRLTNLVEMDGAYRTEDPISRQSVYLPVKTVEDLLWCTISDVLSTKNLGKKTLWELREILFKKCLHLKGDELWFEEKKRKEALHKAAQTR